MFALVSIYLNIDDRNEENSSTMHSLLIFFKWIRACKYWQNFHCSGVYWLSSQEFFVEDNQLEISVYGVQKLLVYITTQIISIFLRIADYLMIHRLVTLFAAENILMLIWLLIHLHVVNDQTTFSHHKR